VDEKVRKIKEMVKQDIETSFQVLYKKTFKTC